MEFNELKVKKDEVFRIVTENYGLNLSLLPELKQLLNDSFQTRRLRKEDGTPNYEVIFAETLKKVAIILGERDVKDVFLDVDRLVGLGEK